MYRRHFSQLAIISLLIFSVVSLQAQEEKKASHADSITIEELRDHMYFLASDELAGRMTGETGYEIAAQYALTQFYAAGLKPAFKDSDGKGIFLQEVPLIQRKINEIKSLIITTSEGTNEFAHVESYVIAFLSSAALETISDIVFVGYGIQEPEHGWDDYEGLDVKGKTIVMLSGAPKRDGEPVLPEKLHKQYASIMGMQQKFIAAIRAEISGAILIADESVLPFWKMIENNLRMSQFVYPESAEAKRTGFSIPTAFVIKMDVAKAVFKGQKFDPTRIGEEGGMEGYGSFTLKDVSLKLDIDCDEQEVKTWNVAAMIEGTDPESKGEVITLGAHLDHSGLRDGKVLNGADDNASGSIALLEIAEALAMNPPKRPVILVLYAAEEVGLFGSRYFVEHSPVPLEEIMVNINLDMIGRQNPEIEAMKSVFTLGSAKICPELKEVLVAVNERTYKLPLDFSLDENDPQGWFNRSDHVHFHENGIPCVFFTNTEHGDYHRPTDDAEKIEFGPWQKICQLVYELTMELGNRDKALCADK